MSNFYFIQSHIKYDFSNCHKNIINIIFCGKKILENSNSFLNSLTQTKFLPLPAHDDILRGKWNLEGTMPSQSPISRSTFQNVLNKSLASLLSMATFLSWNFKLEFPFLRAQIKMVEILSFKPRYL